MATVPHMSLRFHEISESRHRILNPFTAEKLRLLGRICAGERPTRMLDLCCGKAEMLCTWAVEHDVSGIGVDISEVFLAAARLRADDLEVGDRITLVHADAAKYVVEIDTQFDIVSCVGATWIGGGLVGTLDLMRPRVKPRGLLIVGEPYWIDPLPAGSRSSVSRTPASSSRSPARSSGSTPPASSSSRWCWRVPTTGIDTWPRSG